MNAAIENAANELGALLVEADQIRAMRGALHDLCERAGTECTACRGAGELLFSYGPCVACSGQGRIGGDDVGVTCFRRVDPETEEFLYRLPEWCPACRETAALTRALRSNGYRRSTIIRGLKHQARKRL